MRYLLLVLAAMLTIGCTGGRGTLKPSEAEIAAWWIEDLCHGQRREPDELRLVEGSKGMLALAAWCGSPDHPGIVSRLPAIIESRRRRWPVLRAGLAGGDIIASGGRVRATPDAPAAVHELVDAEMQERERGDTIALTVGLAEARSAAAWASAVAEARATLDR